MQVVNREWHVLATVFGYPSIDMDMTGGRVGCVLTCPRHMFNLDQA